MTCVRATFLPSISYEKYLKLVSYTRGRFTDGKFSPFILFTTHPPVITVGRHGKEENLLMRGEWCRSIPVYRVDRGGDVTFHDPGQLMFYPFLPVGSGKSNRDLVKKMEMSALHLLEYYGISAFIDNVNPGVWTHYGKISALGLNLQRGLMTHGMALYVDTNVRIAECIVPCGLKGRGVVSMSRFLTSLPAMEEIMQKWVSILAGIFHMDIMIVKAESIEELRHGLEV